MAQIILDCDLMRFRYSGLYYYCLNLGIHVNRLLAEQNQVPINMYVPPAEQHSFGSADVHIVESKWHKYPYFRSFMKDCKLWHAPFQSGRVMPDKRKHKGVKVLLTIHDLNPLHEGKILREQRKSLAQTQALIDKSDAIVCISEFTRQDVLKNCDVKDKPVHVIHNGVKVDVSYSEFPQAYTPRRPFLFGLGYVNSKKNYHVLLPLLQANPELELIVAGKLDDHHYVESMLQKAAEMGIHDRLHIVGTISDDDRSWYFRNCMAFVHPSLAEGFGNPVIEAMYFGKPVFLSDRTSLPEIGGELGFYFRSFEPDHMIEVFRDGMEKFNAEPEMVTALEERGRWFNWEKAAREYVALYKTLC